MTRIFVSYRRSDASYVVGRIRDSLANFFGYDHVFLDYDSIAIGENFVQKIGDSLDTCAVMVVVMGNDWLDARDEQGQRRLDHPADYVRIEIEQALQRKITVIPVLIEGTRMPAVSDLPASLASLSHLNAATIRPDPDFNGDLGKVIQAIRNEIYRPNATQPARSPAAANPKRELAEPRPSLAWAQTSLVAAIVVFVLVLPWLGRMFAKPAPGPNFTELPNVDPLPEPPPQPKETPDSPAKKQDKPYVPPPDPPKQYPVPEPVPDPIPPPEPPPEPVQEPVVYRVELLQLQCIEPNDLDREDQVYLKLKVDGKDYDPRLKLPHNHEGTPCVNITRGQIWKFNIKLEFREKVEATFVEFDGLRHDIEFVINAQTIEQGLLKLESPHVGIQKHEYTLDWVALP